LTGKPTAALCRGDVANRIVTRNQESGGAGHPEIGFVHPEEFPDTNGWRYAQFLYDAATDTFTPYGSDSFDKNVCYQCQTLVKDRDYIFTNYPLR
jgi:hypothetical protein